MPAPAPATHDGRRRKLTITLCGDRRGRTAMHRVSMGGRDPEVRRALEVGGISVRDARGGSWKVETCFKDFEAAARFADRVREHAEVSVRSTARWVPPSPA